MAIGLTDAPLNSITGELLGVRDHIDALVQFISSCNTPMTIAFQGDWGTGKTSMMKLVETQLPKKIARVWFNTWQFSQFNMQEDVPIALLLELLRQIGTKQSMIKEITFSFIKRTAVLATTVIGGKEAGEATESALAVNPLDIYAQIRDLREKLEKAIAEKLEKSGSDRIVIFVDDLDRMNPGRAIELLEVIKNFMDLPGCVFVLAVDYGVVSRGARQKYGEDMDEAKGRSFFDKIIQLPFNLPVSQYNITRYLKEILAAPAEDLQFYRELAASSVGTNPRGLKRLANVMNLLKLLAAKNYKESLERPEFQRILFAVLCLQMAFEPVYLAIMSSDNPADFFDMSAEARNTAFAGELARCPGNKDEVQERFGAFMDALLKALPKLPDSDDVDRDLFTDILDMSGLTASGGSALQKSAQLRNSFDPALLAQMPSLCDELTSSYKSFWDLLGLLPTFRMRDAKFILPLAFCGSVTLEIHLIEDGIDIYFYTQNSARSAKRPFRDMLRRIAPDLEKKGHYSGSAGSFLSFPVVPWKSSIEDKSKEASDNRARQVKEILEHYARTLLPPIEKICLANGVALNQMQEFVLQIEASLKNIFRAENGWEIHIGEKGVNFFEWNYLLRIRKAAWSKDDFLALHIDGDNNCRFGIKQYWDDKFREKMAAENIYQQWLRLEPQLNEEAVHRLPGWLLWAYVPSPPAAWLKDKYFSQGFAFILDEEQQNLSLETIENYAQRTLALEKEIDAWARDSSN